jgi:competence transcription factor ComK
MERTTNGLRAALFEELESLRAGRSTPHKAVAVAALAAQIVRSAALDIRYQEHVRHSQNPETPLEFPKLTLAA